MNVFLTDLDDTLFSSMRKHIDPEGLVAAAVDTNRQPICFSNATQRALAALMTSGESMVIPVTARNSEAFSRATVPEYQYAICTNGATILHAGGDVVAEWASKVSDTLELAEPCLKDLLRKLDPWAKANDVRMWLASDSHIGPAYLVAKSNKHDAHLLLDKKHELDSLKLPWVGTIHCNDNNLAVIPRGISKLDASNYLIDLIRNTHPDAVFYGVGDSASDWPFMSACHFAIVPTDSQLSHRVSDLGACV